MAGSFSSNSEGLAKLDSREGLEACVVARPRRDRLELRWRKKSEVCRVMMLDCNSASNRMGGEEVDNEKGTQILGDRAIV